MSTAYCYNGYGAYDSNGDEKGTWITYTGQRFWFPYGKVRVIPDWTLQELDHNLSTPSAGEHGQTAYLHVRVSGGRLANEMLNPPAQSWPYHSMGIRVIEGKSTGKSIQVPAGVADGQVLMVEVLEREPTKREIAECEQAANAYKQQMIQDYFQSKREAMMGKPGKASTKHDPMIRVYMDELGVKDIDDVLVNSKTAGITPEVLAQLLKGVSESTGEAIAANLAEAVRSVRKADGPQLAPAAKRSLNLAEHAKAYDLAQSARDAAQAAKETVPAD